MLIKKAKYRTVMVKQRKEVSPNVYGCDECAKEIGDYPNEEERLEAAVFNQNDDGSNRLHFCSWRCMLKHIPKIKSDYFVSLPYLYYDGKKNSKRGANSLIKILSKINP